MSADSEVPGEPGPQDAGPDDLGPEDTGPEDVGSEQAAEQSDGAPEVRQARAPWHFKVLVAGSVVYLGWRAYQGISWLAHHIH